MIHKTQQMGTSNKIKTRHNWNRAEVINLLAQPFNDLIYAAQKIHRENFDPNKVQLSTLMNIKTGGCPEDCAYCPQSAHYKTTIEAEGLLDIEAVLTQAKLAKEKGASRFCMGAAWRQPKERDLEKVINMVQDVKKTGLETCVTLGMLSKEQALSKP